MNDIERLQQQIIECKNNSDLSKEVKKVRLEVLKTYLQKKVLESQIEGLIEEYKQKVSLFSSYTDSEIVFSSNIKRTLKSLEEYIFSSEIYQCLQKNKRYYDNFIILKNYIYEYSNSHKIAVGKIIDVIELHQLLDQIIRSEKAKIYKMSQSCNEIFSTKLFSKCDDGYTNDRGGHEILLRKNKTPSDYFYNGQNAVYLLKQYLEQQILDADTHLYSMEMTENIFENYLWGLIEIPISDYRKIY